MLSTKRHSFHLVDSSPWPLLGSISALAVTLGAVLYFHGFYIGETLLMGGFVHLILVSFAWWRDVVDEATFRGCHTRNVQYGLRLGMFVGILIGIYFHTGSFNAMEDIDVSPGSKVSGPILISKDGYLYDFNKAQELKLNCDYSEFFNYVIISTDLFNIEYFTLDNFFTTYPQGKGHFFFEKSNDALNEKLNSFFELIKNQCQCFESKSGNFQILPYDYYFQLSFNFKVKSLGIPKEFINYYVRDFLPLVRTTDVSIANVVVDKLQVAIDTKLKIDKQNKLILNLVDELSSLTEENQCLISQRTNLQYNLNKVQEEAENRGFFRNFFYFNIIPNFNIMNNFMIRGFFNFFRNWW